jgi:redox-regulated HSP33 family molecular chaperone
MIDSQYLAHFDRYIWDDANLIVVLGDATALLRGRKAYLEGHQIETMPVPEAEPALSRLLAAAGLAAVSLAQRESWGWTLTLPGEPVGLFCAVEPEGRICGRIRAADPMRSAAVLQRQRTGGPLVQSHVEATTSDPAAIVQHYFRQAPQIATRLAIDDAGPCVLVQALPDSSLAPVADWSDAELVARTRQLRDEDALRRLEEVLLFYDCRCDDEMILNMIASLPAAQQREVWEGRDEVQAECPRCGRTYTIRRRPVEGAGDS